MKKSFFYNTRRKLQVAACSILPMSFISKIFFRIVVKKTLNLKNPQSFNEKLQWLKLYYWPKNTLAIECADKYNVRNYVERKGYSHILNELYGVYDSVDEINWNSFPDRFVLKCVHGCGYNIICKDKENFDIENANKQLKKWMKEDFGKFNAEPHYSSIKPKIICEKYLGNIVNYNIFCCNGKPEFFSVIEGLGEGKDEALTYYYADKTRAEFYNQAYPQSNKELPEIIDTMLDYAKEFAADFPFVRVDFYEVEGQIILSELTFTPGGALINFYPEKYDGVFGEKLNIEHLK